MRNVLLIVIDQLRLDCIRMALGNRQVMPVLNRLRRDSVTFNRHYTVATPCGPSRASLLTGLYCQNHRSVRNGTPLRAGITNLPLEARKQGYEPLLYGYTDTAVDPRSVHPNDPDLITYEGVMPGFNEVVEMRLESGSFPWRAHLAGRGYALPPFSDYFLPTGSDPETGPDPRDPPFYRAEDSDTAFLADAFLRDIKVRSDRNWLALLTFVRPHPPLIAPEPYNRTHDPCGLPLPVRLPSLEDEAGVHPFMAAELKRNAISGMVAGFGDSLDNESDADVGKLRAVYFGLASEVDHHVGRIVDYLTESGQLDQTLLIVTSDHGEMLGDRGQWGKFTVFDAAYRAPLLIRDPARPDQRGSDVDAFTESVDVASTILDWIAGEVPSAMNGASLLPFLDGAEPERWRDCAAAEFDFGDPARPTIWQTELGTGLRESNVAIIWDQRFKLVHFNGGLPPLLFDMKSSEGELRNLAQDPAAAPELLRMTRKLLDHRMRHADHALSDMKLTSSGTVNFRP